MSRLNMGKRAFHHFNRFFLKFWIAVVVILVLFVLYQYRATSFSSVLKDDSIERIGILYHIEGQTEQEKATEIFDENPQNIAKIVRLLDSYPLKPVNLAPNLSGMDWITLYLHYQDKGAWDTLSVDIASNGSISLLSTNSKKLFVSKGTEELSQEEIYYELYALIQQLYY